MLAALRRLLATLWGLVRAYLESLSRRREAGPPPTPRTPEPDEAPPTPRNDVPGSQNDTPVEVPHPQPRSLISVPGVERTDNAFRWELVQLAERLGLDPDWLAVTMSIESGFNPRAVNPKTGATGLIQFMPSTAKGLGTSVAELRKMPAIEQLRYVEAHYRNVRGTNLKSPAQTYLAVFMPAYVHAPPDKVVSTRGHPVYDQNAGLDADKDGTLTVGDISAVASSRYAAGMKRPRVPVSPPTGATSASAARNGIITLFLGIASTWALYKWGRG